METMVSKHLPWGLSLLMVLPFLVLSIPKSWEDATQVSGDGSITLADDWAGTIERKKSKYDRHDLYMLTATRDGNFLCKHCPIGHFYLKAGEIYRYGTTGNNRDGRGYSKLWLAEKKLTYVHILTADLVTVKKTETSLIGTYVVHPENLARPIPNTSQAKPYWYRLVLPPGNNRLD